MTRLATEILAQLVSFDTTSRNSNLDLIAWIEDYLARHGVTSTRVPDETGTKSSLWATIGPKDRPGYVLSGHTDTVPVDGQDWTTDPFELVERDGRLYGRGTCDMKGFLACCLARVADMRSAALTAPIHLAFSYDEEIGCTGVRPMLAIAHELAPVRPLAAFIGEPTSMQVVVGHKGKHNYRLVAHGRPCHSSRAPEGVNAIDAAAEIVLLIRDIARRLEREGAQDELYDIPFSTAHTGTMRGGTILNIVPELCEVDFEFRMLHGEDHAPFLAEIEARARQVTAEMRARAPETGIEIVLVNGTPGFDTALDAPATLLAKRLAGRNDHAKVAYGTEAGLFAVMAGIPSVVVGPGSIEQAHRPDEFIELSELGKCDAFLTRLIEHASGPAN